MEALAFELDVPSSPNTYIRLSSATVSTWDHCVRAPRASPRSRAERARAEARSFAVTPPSCFFLYFLLYACLKASGLGVGGERGTHRGAGRAQLVDAEARSARAAARAAHQARDECGRGVALRVTRRRALAPRAKGPAAHGHVVVVRGERAPRAAVRGCAGAAGWGAEVNCGAPG